MHRLHVFRLQAVPSIFVSLFCLILFLFIFLFFFFTVFTLNIVNQFKAYVVLCSLFELVRNVIP